MAKLPSDCQIWWIYLKPRPSYYDWRFSVRRFWPRTLMSRKSIATFGTDTQHLYQVSWKSDLYFSRKHNQCHKQTNQPTKSSDHNISWRR